MGRWLSRGFQRWRLGREYWRDAASCEEVRFENLAEARRFLEGRFADPLAISTLRSILAEDYTGISLNRMTNQQVLREVAQRLVGKRLYLWREPMRMIPTIAGPSVQPAVKEEAPTKPSKQPVEAVKEIKKSWIKIELVDEQGNLISGESFKITLPGGKVVTDKLNQSGFARIEDIDAGTCQVTFPNLDKSYQEKA